MSARAAVGIMLALSVSLVHGQRAADRSGVYTSTLGDLSILEGDRAILFSYEAVFGRAAHLCDWGAVAKRESDTRFTVPDPGGTATLTFSMRDIRLDMTEGSPSSCGAGWPGDRFPVASRVPPSVCTVRSPRATFFDISNNTPLTAYVVAGDRVDIVASQQVDANAFVLARFTGANARTVGLLKKADLACAR